MKRPEVKTREIELFSSQEHSKEHDDFVELVKELPCMCPCLDSITLADKFHQANLDGVQGSYLMHYEFIA